MEEGPGKHGFMMSETVTKALASKKQFAECHLKAASGPNKILKPDVKLIESVQDGFSMEFKLEYLKSLKKLLLDVPQYKELVERFSFGNASSESAKVDFSADDIEELRKNKIIGEQIDLTFD